MKMPAEFFGVVRGHKVNCGICQRIHVFQVIEGLCNGQLRALGWTWRNDLGWVCPCRHQCGNLDPKQEPQLKRKRTHPRRHKSESEKARQKRIRRNRQRAVHLLK